MARHDFYQIKCFLLAVVVILLGDRITHDCTVRWKWTLNTKVKIQLRAKCFPQPQM